MSDHWTQHRLLRLFHCLFGIQQYRIYVSITSLTLRTLVHDLCSDKWGMPHLTLSTYLKFWSVVCFLVTGWLLLFKKEVSHTYWHLASFLTMSTG